LHLVTETNSRAQYAGPEAPPDDPRSYARKGYKGEGEVSNNDRGMQEIGERERARWIFFFF